MGSKQGYLLKSFLLYGLSHLLFFPDNTGILLASGDNWTRMRRFTLKALRDHGFGKKASETYILDEALHMVEHLR